MTLHVKIVFNTKTTAIFSPDEDFFMRKSTSREKMNDKFVALYMKKKYFISDKHVKPANLSQV